MTPVRRGSPLGQLGAFVRAEERESAPAPQPLAAGSVDRFVAAAMAELTRSTVANDAAGSDVPALEEEPRAGASASKEPPPNDEGAPSSVVDSGVVAPGVPPAAAQPANAEPAAIETRVGEPPSIAHPRGRIFAWATALALAACLALWLLPSRRGGALPAYDLGLAGGVADTRSEPAPAASAPLVLAPGSRIVVTLRPATRVDGPVAARAFLVRGDVRVALDLEATTSPDGAVRLSGVVADPALPLGPAELVVMVGRDAGALGEPRPESDEVRVLRRAVRVEVGGR